MLQQRVAVEITVQPKKRVAHSNHGPARAKGNCRDHGPAKANTVEQGPTEGVGRSV